MELPTFDLSSLFPGRPPGDDHGAPIQIADDLAWLRCGIVNVAFLGHPDAGDRGWVLVDAGLPGFGSSIARAAEARFGGSRPAAIVLTHGHFDHIGALDDLIDRWDVPVYAHRLEMPYLTGESAYPPADPTVGGGAMSVSSVLFPAGPFDFGEHVRRLPTGPGDDDSSGRVPNTADWWWRHTPGHAPGHVSLWRERDRALVAGDAFVTTDQQSAIAVYEQRLDVQGPPMYFTPDWDASRASVEQLAALDPSVAVTGHGLPMSGPPLTRALQTLARDFDRVARPAHGRYVHEPARMDDSGVRSLPPAVPDTTPLALVGGALVAGVLLGSVRRDR